MRPRSTSKGRRNTGSRFQSNRAPSIPPFRTNSLTTKSIKWLATEAWQDVDALFVSAHAGDLAPQIFVGSPYQKLHNRSCPLFIGRWVLRRDGDRIAGFAEVYGYYNKFNRFHIHLSPLYPGSPWSEASEELALFISGVVIMGSADDVVIIPANNRDAVALKGLGFGVEKHVISPRPVELMVLTDCSATEQHACLHLDPSEWAKTALGGTTLAQLAYLRKRMTRRPAFIKNRTETQTRRTSKSWLTRLLRR